MTVAWTDERIERLKEMWAGGSSASAIADELGIESRNSVIGKVHRLGLPGRRKSSVSKTPRAKINRTRPFRMPPIRPAKTPVLTTREKEFILGKPCTTIFELTDSTCRWPIDNPGRIPAFLFCGEEPVEKLPYCKCHARMAYRE